MCLGAMDKLLCCVGTLFPGDGGRRQSGWSDSIYSSWGLVDSLTARSETTAGIKLQESPAQQ